MGGRIGCGNAGLAWPSASRRIAGLGAAATFGAIATGGGAWAGCTQAQVQLPPLQQSGAFCGDFAGWGMAGACSMAPDAMAWQGAWAWAVLDCPASPAGTCIRTAAMAGTVPFRTMARLNSRRRRKARTDIDLL